MEQQAPIPPTPKSRMKPREGQKRAIFPSLIGGGGGVGEGGSWLSIYFVQDCNLCTDVPTPSQKNREKRLSSPDFYFL